MEEGMNDGWAAWKLRGGCDGPKRKVAVEVELLPNW